MTRPPYDVDRDGNPDAFEAAERRKAELLEKRRREHLELRWVCLDDVEETEAEWFWQDRIPKNELTIIVGPGLAGKSSLVRYLVARTTRGDAMWGDPRPREPRCVIWMGHEESKAKVRRRLRKAGANMKRVCALNDGQSWTTRDIDELQEKVIAWEAELVVIDGGKDFMVGDDQAEKDTRPALMAFVRMCHAIGCTVIVIVHPKKGATSARECISGSHAWRDVPRCTILVGEHNGDRVVAWDKTSDGERPTALKFRINVIDRDPVFEVEKALPGVDANDLSMAQAESKEERSAIEEAVEFLEAFLANGPLVSKDVQRAAKDAGVSDITLRRARERLSVRAQPQRDGGGRVTGWTWGLSEASCSPDTGANEHLDKRRQERTGDRVSSQNPPDAQVSLHEHLVETASNGPLAGESEAAPPGAHSPPCRVSNWPDDVQGIPRGTTGLERRGTRWVALPSETPLTIDTCRALHDRGVLTA